MMTPVLPPPKYVRFILLPPREQEPVWHYHVWMEKVVPVLDDLLNLVGSKCSVHSRQGPVGLSRGAKFGQLRWDDKSHQKWTWYSPLTKGHRSGWSFQDVEVFVPPRSELIKTPRIMPDLYFQAENMNWNPDIIAYCGQPLKACYNQMILVVLPYKHFKRKKIEFEELIERLSKNLGNSPTYTAIRRIWVLNYFESIYREEFLYLGSYKEELPDLSKTKKSWERIR